MEEFIQRAAAVRSSIERYGGKTEWGTLPWLVDRLLDSIGGGVGLDATDMLEVNLAEVQELGALLALLDSEEAVARATALLYDEVAGAEHPIPLVELEELWADDLDG